MPLTRIKLTAIENGGISTAKLANSAITADKLADNAVLTSKLTNNAVTIDKLNNNLALGGNDSGGTAFDITLPQGVGGTNWSNPVQSASFTATTSNGYFINTSSTGSGVDSITVSLPTTNLSAGKYVSLVDYKGTASLTAQNSSTGEFTNRIIINAGTVPIEGVVGLRDIGSPKGAAQLVYVDGTQGWVVTSAANEGTAKSLIPSTPTITSVLNNLGFGYFQDSSATSAKTMTITGTNFVSNASVVLVPSDGSANLTPDSINVVSSTSITFVVSDAIITDAINSTTAFDDRYDVKVTNPDNSFVSVNDALEYAPAPTFSTATALNTSAQPITTNSNNPLRDTFAELNTASTIVAESLDYDDVITYSLVSNDAGINGIAVDSNGAISGTPSASPIVSGTYYLVVRATATSNETSQTKTTDKTFEVIMEAEVAAPTISAVGQSHISQSANNITITGTGFFGSVGTFNGTIEIIDPTNSSNTYPASTKTVTTATGNDATVLTFVTTQDMVDAIRTLGISGSLDESFNVKVTNPAGAGSYEKTVTFDDAFEYKAAPEFQVSAGNVGTLQAEIAQDYSTLTGLSSGKLDAVIRDPDDTNLQHSLVSVASELSGLTINQSTGAITGTADLTSVAAGSYNFGVQVQSTSDETNAVTQDTRTYSITVAAISSFYSTSIGRSLRFDGSSYLSKTFGTPTNQFIYTFSAWIKRATVANEYLFTAYNNSTSTGNTDRLELTSSHEINVEIRDGSGSESQKITTALYRDTSAFYHIVFSVSNASGIKIYVNGSEETNLSTDAGSIGSTWAGGINVSNRTARIGAYGYWSSGEAVLSTNRFNGYMANIDFIDGQTLTPASFGESSNGIWIPKAFNSTLDYGANGFRLDFSPNSIVLGTSGVIASINDVATTTGMSGHTSANNWTAN